MPAMRSLPLALVTFVACAPKPSPSETPTASPSTDAPAAQADASEPELLAADTPKTTVAGNTFIAPSGWTIVVRGQATILEAPEAGSRIAFVDVKASDADAAVELAWAAYGAPRWPLLLTTELPDQDGWTKTRLYDYQTPPNEKRILRALAKLANDTWTVAIFDIDQAVGEKRGSQVGLIFGRLLPKGYTRESFAGKTANTLDQARIDELAKFVETAQAQLGVPGVSIGLIQGGKVVYAGGFGVRELGKKAKVDADTKYIVASNTKALTTLMLAKLVDQGKFTWDTKAVSVLPSFKLGDAATTEQVQIKHLVCACTGMPRQDLEWVFEYGQLTPEGSLATLATMQPTSAFGELFQYSNPMASAAGFVGGFVVDPKLELGKGYDEAMRKLVFEPLGMQATTFDFKRAQKGNVAHPHVQDVDGKATAVPASLNELVVPVRPAGGAYSSLNDMLDYVQLELAEGKLPSGEQYISREVLLARRAPQVAMSTDETYGMGLMVDKTWGVEVVHHGGDIIGFHSDMMWLPEHGVGAVVLTNGDPGWLIRSIFQRKLLEVLFDGRPEADAELAAAGKRFFEQLAAERKLLTIPADPVEAGKLAAHYRSPALGDIRVTHKGDNTSFDVGEWRSSVASKRNPDGTISFVTITPGMIGFEFLVGAGSPRSLIIRDAQHEYAFVEVAE